MPPPPRTTPLSKPKLLIGEGQEEVFFFGAFLKKLNITDFQIEQYGGKAFLSTYLKELKIRPGHSMVNTLAITRDSDDDAASAFTSICGFLAANGFSVPPAPGQITTWPPRVGIYLLPDNHQPGMLEDLCLAAAQADPAMPCVDDFFQCIATKSGRKPKNMAKARVHAWLASQHEPDLRLGEAAQKDYLPWHDPAFQTLAQFLQNL